MTRKPDIQYIEHFFVPGAEAPKVQPKRGEKREQSVVRQPAKPKVRVLVDPVALVGMVVAVTMLILMAVGIFRFSSASQARQEMAAYLNDLQDENLMLKYDYHTGYDLARVEEQAKALGMIPVSEAKTVAVSIVVPEHEPEPSLWENICWFVNGLFA